MTNKEKYQRTFSALHASDDCLLEVKKMNRVPKKYVSKLAAACLAAVMVLGLSVGAYAADIGGIQRMIQIWLHGEQTDAILEIQNGEYTLGYQDEAGNDREIHGGGVAIDASGEERPVTEEEIMEHLSMPEVTYKDDGSVWVYYQDQKLEVTDKFDEDGICYVTLRGSTGDKYLTIKYQNGYAVSPNKYLDPDSFNAGH